MNKDINRKKLYFTHAYGYAAAIAQRLNNPEGRIELLRWIDSLSPDFQAAVYKPDKKSVLHKLIYDLAYFDWEHEITHWNLKNLDQFFSDHEESIPNTLRKETDTNHGKLCNCLEKPISKLVESAFYILFGDRNALFLFNKMIATKIQELTPNEMSSMRRPGVIPRPSYIPTWLRKAVFHRDKGRCQLCHRDLTGRVNPIANAQFDHMWPLAQSGSNDVTNFQLLCSTCNFKKRDDGNTTNEYYSYW